MKDAIYMVVKFGELGSIADHILGLGWTEEMLREETPKTLFDGLKEIYQTESELVELSDGIEAAGFEEGDKIAVAYNRWGGFTRVLGRDEEEKTEYDEEEYEYKYGTVRVITERDCKDVLEHLDEIFDADEE